MASARLQRTVCWEACHGLLVHDSPLIQMPERLRGDRRPTSQQRPVRRTPAALADLGAAATSQAVRHCLSQAQGLTRLKQYVSSSTQLLCGDQRHTPHDAQQRHSIRRPTAYSPTGHGVPTSGHGLQVTAWSRRTHVRTRPAHGLSNRLFEPQGSACRAVRIARWYPHQAYGENRISPVGTHIRLTE